MNQRRALLSVVCVSALLYGCETWVLTYHTVAYLRATQQSLLRAISGLKIIPQPDGSVRYPSTSEVLEATGSVDIENLIRRRRLALAAKIFADPWAPVATTAKEQVASRSKYGRTEARRPDWLRQVLNDATHSGIALGHTWSHQMDEQIRQTDFVDVPLRGAVRQTHPPDLDDVPIALLLAGLLLDPGAPVVAAAASGLDTADDASSDGLSLPNPLD